MSKGRFVCGRNEKHFITQVVVTCEILLTFNFDGWRCKMDENIDKRHSRFSVAFTFICHVYFDGPHHIQYNS